MRAARYIPTRWWLDRGFLALSGDGQRALWCLWSAPETPTSGITTVVAATLAERLRISPKVAASRLVELEQAGFVSIDHEARLIWLHDYVETQLGGLPATHARWVTSTISALQNLPDTALTRRFRVHYGLPDRGSHRVSGPKPTPTDTPNRDATSTIRNHAPSPCPASPSQGGTPDHSAGGRSA